jgi:hypothetical protein
MNLCKVKLPFGNDAEMLESGQRSMLYYVSHP